MSVYKNKIDKNMENYKQRYKEALERASKLRVQNPFDTVGQMVEHIFPELKENEDERIRKQLCDFLRDNMLHQDAQYFISWLEKQGKRQGISALYEWDNSTGEHYWVLYGVDKDLIVTHWMPLPEAPTVAKNATVNEKGGKL